MITREKKLKSFKTLWSIDNISLPPYSPLTKRHLTTDVVIIGAGISGAMIAEELTDEGFEVVLLDRREPLCGSTSASTALLQCEIDTPLSLLAGKIGFSKAARAWQRSKLGLENLAAKVESLSIDCNLQRRNTLYLAGDTLDAEGLKLEKQQRLQAGLYSKYLSRRDLALGFNIHRAAALMSFGEFTANPQHLAAGFLMAALRKGARIFAPHAVSTVKPGKRSITVETEQGHRITAKHVVFATGYELPRQIKTKKHSISSTWAFATPPQQHGLWPGEAMIWEASSPYLYIRSTKDGRVICGGEDEPFSNEEKRDALISRKTATLQRKLGKIFPHLDTTAEFAWTGCFGTSTTGLPSIGRLPGMPNCYAILAFGGNGITFSRIAAEIILADIQGQRDVDAEIFGFPHS